MAISDHYKKLVVQNKTDRTQRIYYGNGDSVDIMAGATRSISTQFLHQIPDVNAFLLLDPKRDELMLKMAPAKAETPAPVVTKPFVSKPVLNEDNK